MKIDFSKYHALGNDFIVVKAERTRLARTKLGGLAKAICDRKSGVGADGILYLSKSRIADRRIDVYNADGSWAEKSGNGLRIAALSLATELPQKKHFRFEIGSSLDHVWLEQKTSGGFMVRAEIGTPDFLAKRVPVRTRRNHVINQPIRIGAKCLVVTCLSVGNPHVVIPVDAFDFDWKELGQRLEHDKMFPHGTNVEFVRVVNRRKLRVNDWERGAGATGSSGTGAAAAVCALVMLGKADRSCEVQFESGSLHITWRARDNVIELLGPAQYIMTGRFDYGAIRIASRKK